MIASLASLWPFFLASWIVPLTIMLVILLLRSPNQGVQKAVAYIAGMTTVRLLQGLIFGLVFNRYEEQSQAVESGKSPVALTLMTVMGLMLLISAFKKWRKEVDADEQPPKWMTKLDTMTPFNFFVFGFSLMLLNAKMWVFTLGALDVIAGARLGLLNAGLTYLLYIVLAQAILLTLLGLRILFPGPAGSVLERISTFLDKNERAISIAVYLLFGAFFLAQGLGGLLGG